MVTMHYGIRTGCVLVLFIGALQVCTLRGQTPIPFEHVVVDADNPSNPHCKTLGDIDADGDLDIVSIGWFNDKVWLVEGDEYLLKLTRYIHLNPVKIRAMASRQIQERRKLLRNYRWSSYRAYAGLSKRPEMVDYGPLTELVSRGMGKQGKGYRRYVETGLAADDDELLEALAGSSKAIGLEPFRQWSEKLYRNLTRKQGQPLDVAMRRPEFPVTPQEIMKVVQGEFDVSPQELRSRRNASDARLLTMKLLHEEAAMSQRQVAVELGLQDGSGVSRRLSELAARMNRERKLKRCYDRLRGKLFR